MAIQTLLPYDLNERNAASNAAQSLATGLEGLLKGKVEKMQQRQMQANQAKAYAAAGIPQQEAELLAASDPQTQQLILKNYLAGAESAGLEQALGGLGGQQQMQPQMQPQLQQALGGLQGQPQDMIIQNLMKGLGAQQQASQPMVQQPQQQQQGSIEQQGTSLAQALTRPRLNPQHRLKIEEMKQRKELAERKLNQADQARVDKETLPTFKDINEKAKAAKDSDQRLNRIERLLDKGRVQDNIFIRSLGGLKSNKYIGGIADAIGTLISNKDTQEFEKLSTDFVKDAKQFFGSRITEAEVQLFLKTVPSLSQTNEGKRRVIRNMRIFNEAAELKQKAMNQIIKENGGTRPANLESLIDDRIGGQLDALKNQFTEGDTITPGILPTLL